MDALLNTFRESYAAFGKMRSSWDESHAASVGLVSVVVNAMERMSTLERFDVEAHAKVKGKGGDHGGKVEGTDEGATALALVTAQYEALDRVFTRLNEELETCDALVRKLEVVKREAWKRARALDPPLRMAGGEKMGPQPSIAECVLGLEDAWVMYRDESALKREIVKKLAVCEDIEALKTLLIVFTEQPNLDPEELRMIVERVPVKNVEAVLR